MTSANVSIFILETSQTFSRSSGYDQQYDKIPFEMVDGHQSFRSRNAHSSSRSQYIPLYGCQSLWMGSSSRTDESILSWSLVRRPIPAPYQYVGNNGHSFRTEESQKVYSPFFCHDFYRQHNSGLIYQQARRNTFSQPLRRGVEDPHLVLEQHIIVRVCHIPGRVNVLADRLSRMDKPIKTEWALDQSIANSVFQMFNYPNVDLFATGFNHKLSLYIPPVLDSQALAIDAFSMNWNLLHVYAFPPAISIPSVLAKIRQSQCRIVLIAPLWPQCPVVLRGFTITCVSPRLSSAVSNTTDTSKRKVSTSKPPITLPSCLGVIKQSIRDKKFSQNVADFVSKSRRTSTQKVYDAKWTVYSNWCHRKKVNLVSAPLTVKADFLIYLFSEKKYQISTVKGYRSMIYSTLKFKTGNRVGSNPVLSE